MLMSFQSDGWACMTPAIKTSKVDGRSIRRQGFARTEYLLEVQSLKTIEMDGSISMVMRPPQIKRLGRKDGWTISQSACDAAPVLGGQRGRESGVVISLYMQDGLHAGGS